VLPAIRLARLLEEVAAVFFPPLCLLCEASLGDERPEVCPACRGAFRKLKLPFCGRCGSPGPTGAAGCRVCAGWRDLTQARSALLFVGSVRSWIHQLKYGGVAGLAPLAGEPLEASFREAPRAWREAAALVPVPLYPARRRERGFNQSALLAEELARRIGIPSLELLERLRATAPQVDLTAAERRGNVRGAFRVRDAVAAFCHGRSFLLVDDVLTTGATLEAAAAALMEGGAGRVWALTLARALPGRDA
jgi:ComF family protein